MLVQVAQGLVVRFGFAVGQVRLQKILFGYSISLFLVMILFVLPTVH
jgi:hypothetical protein